MSLPKTAFVKLTEGYVLPDRHPQNKQPNLSLAYCISLLENRGYKSVLIDTDVKKLSKKDIVETIISEETEIVFISNCVPVLAPQIMELSADLKAGGVRLVALCDLPQTLASFFLCKAGPIDLMVLGEMEETVKEIVCEYGELPLNLSQIRGIAYFENGIRKTPERPLIENIDALPFPKHELLIGKGYDMIYPVKTFRRVKWGHIMSSRGCPFRCQYCAVRVSYGDRMRARSAENICDEIEYLLAKGVNTINFVDDNFLFSRRHVKDLCGEIIRRGLKFKWLCQIHPGLMNEELAGQMHAAGCATVCIGVESGSERILKILDRETSTEMISREFAALNKAGIWTIAYVILGNPTETAEEMRQTYRFVKSLKPELLQVSFFTPYPNSRFYSRLDRQARRKITGWSHYNRISGNFSRISDARLVKFQRRFYLGYLLNPGFLIPFVLRRIPYSIANAGCEAGLIKEVLGYFLRPPSVRI